MTLVSWVGRNPDRLTSVRREVAVAAWLAAQGDPAAQLVTAAQQPVVVQGHPVTFWEGLADGDTHASTGEWAYCCGGLTTWSRRLFRFRLFSLLTRSRSV